jgi:protein-S-isoprenylcysteine O-methyltransferase Ste14
MSGPYWAIIAWCWVVFWVYWTVSGLRIRAPRRKASLAFTILNTALLYAGFVLVLVGRQVIGPLAIRFTSEAAYSYIAYIVGTAFVVAGVALAIWSRRVLGSNWSGAVRITEGQRLVQTGPYAFVRNPIYSGIALAVLGTALVAGTIGGLVGFALVVASLWQKGRLEERFLLAEFGDRYAAYQRKVKFLIPFVV